MAHELVFRNGKALMLYVKRNGADVPWHKFGQPFETAPDLETVKKVCGFDRTVNVCEIGSKKPNGESFVLPDAKAVIDSCGRYLGVVGSEFRPLQDHDMVDTLLPWLEGGFAEVETAGMLKGGARTWVQLRLKGGEVEIAPGDAIQKYLMVAQGHDQTLSLVSGRVCTRIVCNNTLSVSLSEGGLIRGKHRGNIRQKSVDIQAKLLEWAAQDEKVIAAFQYLASKNVDVKGVNEFINALTKKDDEAADRKNGPGDRIRANFVAGIGNKGETWWHLLNAVSEDVTHGLGNNRSGDVEGDREGRTLNKMFFGQGQKLNQDAFKVAINLASGRTADAKLNLDLAA